MTAARNNLGIATQCVARTMRALRTEQGLSTYALAPPQGDRLAIVRQRHHPDRDNKLDVTWTTCSPWPSRWTAEFGGNPTRGQSVGL